MGTSIGKISKLTVDLLFNPVVRWLEKILAVVVLAGVIMAAVKGGIYMAGLDRTAIETFYDLIYRILLLVIGLELVRMLITHSLATVPELLSIRIRTAVRARF